MIRVTIPVHLRTLAGAGKEVSLRVDGPVTQRAILDALEAAYPTLRGTVRDRASGQRRPWSASPAGKTCRTSRRTHRCPTRWRRAQSRF